MVSKRMRGDFVLYHLEAGMTEEEKGKLVVNDLSFML